MRDIKFRAWHINNKAFEYYTFLDIWTNGWQCCEGHNYVVDPHKMPKSKDGIYTTEDYIKSEFDYNFINKAAFNQYIGLDDKNGKGIYEGDIVECSRIIKKRKRIDRFNKKSTYDKWNETGSWIMEIKFGQRYGWVGETIGFNAPNTDIEFREVIGNIYENPELLKEAL